MARSRTAFFFAVILLVLGCRPAGPKMYPVHGTVSYQGKPLPLGTIMLVPVEGPPSKPARIDKDGRYSLTAPAGKCFVMVVAMPERPGGRPNPAVEGSIDYSGVPEVPSLIPTKYNRYDMSEISVMVQSGKSNSIDIDLK